MKNKFFAGLFTGTLISLIICTILVTMIVRGADNNEAMNLDRINGADQSTESTGSGLLSNLADALNGKDKTDSTAELEAKKTYIKNLISKYFMGEVTEEQYQTAELRAILDALEDPYSCYYTKAEYEDMMESSSGTYCGIGSTVNQNSKTGIITIVKPFIGGPAYKAGILPEDIIYKVDGEEVTGKDLSAVVSTMKGEPGTKVMIEVVREGEEKPLEFEITRDTIEVPTIEYEMLNNKIGYIYIMEFDEVTEEQFRDAIDKLIKLGMKGLVIDVRDNPGGLLNIVSGMLDRMLPEGLIVYTEDKYGNRSEHLSTDEEKFNLPLTVLVNGNSASAAEIFAGAIQDYEIGTIVGTNSFGKGIVQSIFPLYDGSAVKMTISYYFTPKGRNIHKIGITPDVEVELNEGLSKLVTIPKEQDNQLQKAIEILMKKIK